MSEPLRILYAEDSASDADLTRACFAETPDLALEVVGSGTACLARLAAERWDLVLLDHHLPDMDGLDVLRELFRTGSTMPVVLVTGAGDENLVIRALRLGAVNYVPKTPGYCDALPGVARAAIEEHRRRLAQGLAVPVRRRILYVEHQAMDVDLACRHFADAAPSFEIENVRTCAEALARLSQPQRYDAAIVDLRMPDQSGLDFVREAHGRRLPMPPFVMVSGRGDDAAAIASLRLGAADYVAKRDGYLDQLVYTVERAIAYDQLERLNTRLQDELAERQRAERERDRLEEQLRVARKLEALGSLAGGIAHDFNNLLSVILSYTEVALAERKTDARLATDLAEVRRAAERGAALTRQLLAFGRKQVLAPVPLDLNQVARELGHMLQHVVGDRVRYVQDLGPDLGIVKADRGQIEQVLLNLVVNARDAMPDGGTLTLSTANVEIGPDSAAREVGLQPGAYVRLAVTDTGCGMDEPTMTRIFEPLFTTKQPGKGTGLGLSTVYGIVQQSGGVVRVRSSPGEGSTFTVLLPRAAQPDGRNG